MSTYSFTKNQLVIFGAVILSVAMIFAVAGPVGAVFSNASFYVDEAPTQIDGSGGGGSYFDNSTSFSGTGTTSYVNTSNNCGNGDPVDLNGDGMYSQDEVGCSCSIKSSYGDWSFNYWKTDPAPTCTLDLTKEKLTWSTTHATQVLISPLTNSPQIPGFGSFQGTIKDIILSGDFWNTYWQVHKSKVAADAYAHGGVSLGNAEPYANQATADRLCSLLDPNAKAIVWKADSYSSPYNNSIILWNGSSWEKHGAKNYNKHLRYQFTCATIEYVDSYPLNGTHYFNPELGIGTHSYKLVAVGPGGSTTCTDSITISAPDPAPTCTLDLSKYKLEWTTDYATSVTIKPLTNSPQIPGSGGGSGSVVFSGDFHNGFWLPNFSKVQQDAYAHGGISITTGAGAYANQATADRLCSLLNPNAKAVFWKGDSYSSPENNYIILWNGSSWEKHGAKYYNKHLRYQFTCATSGTSSSYPLDGSHTFIPPLGVGTHTYELTATGSGGTEVCTDTITVDPEPKPDPICTLDLSKYKLEWTSTNATKVDIEPLTDSPAIPGASGGSGGSGVTVFNGSFDTFWSQYKNKVSVDAYTYGSVYIGNAEPYANQATADRLCSLVDPNAKATSWHADSYSSPHNNSIIKWDGSAWKKYGASSYNKHLRYGFTCTKFEETSAYPLSGTHYFNPPLGVGTHTYQLTATGPGGVDICTDTITIDPEPTPDPTGTIKICKLIIDEDQNVINGAGTNSLFGIDGVGHTTTFNTPLSFNADLVENSCQYSKYHSNKDAECVTYDNLPLGTYTYDEEHIAGGNWEEPRYNDNFHGQVSSFENFYFYNPTGNAKADGKIVLTKEKPFRKLVILNQKKEVQHQAPTCSVDIDPNYIHKGGNAILSWTSSNANSAAFDHGIGSKNPNGSITVSPNETTTYTGTFTGPGGTVDCSVELKVKTGGGGSHVPACYLSANPTTLPVGGGNTTISWTTTNAFSGTIEDSVGLPDTKNLDPLASGSMEVYVDTTTTFTAEVVGKYNKTSSCNVTVKVEKPTTGCTNCGGGGVPFDPHVALTQRPFPSETELTVSLTQVPYTGFATGPWGAFFFWVVVFGISASAAYVVVSRRWHEALLGFVLMSNGSQPRHPFGYASNDDSGFDNTFAYGGASPSDQQVPTYTPQTTAASSVPVTSRGQLVDSLESRAHKDSILISSEGLASIAKAADQDEQKAFDVLEKLIGLAKSMYPREDGWILLNSERVQTLLSQVQPAKAPEPTTTIPEPTQSSAPEPQTVAPVSAPAADPFAGSTRSTVAPTDEPKQDYRPWHTDAVSGGAVPSAFRKEEKKDTPAPRRVENSLSKSPEARSAELVGFLANGKEEEAYTLLRTLASEGGNERDFLTQVMCDLDVVYKYRIEGQHLHKPSAEVLAASEKWGTKTLERVLEILADSIDHSYSTSRLGSKMAVAKIFELLSGKA